MTPSPGRSADLISAFVDELRIRGKSPNTRDMRRKVLVAADRDLPYGLDQADPDEIKAWLYRDEWSSSTKADYYQALWQFYCWADGRHLSFNPMAGFPRPVRRGGVPRPVSHTQLQRILAHGADPYDLWALIAAYEGARCIEISNLDREHVDQDDTWLRGKGGKERIVPTHPMVWAAVACLPPGPIARDPLGRRRDPKYVSNLAARHFRHDLGMPGVTLHRCRHWHGTYVQRAGRDTRVTQEILGHASPATTALYTQVAMEDMRAAVSGLPKLTSRRVAAAGGSAAAGPPPAARAA